MDWRKIPFTGRKALLDYIKDTGAEVLVLKGCFFLLSSKINNDQTIEAIKRVFLEGTGDIGELIHTSSQSYRSIYSFREKDENGEVYFIKKICRKSPLYWSHNLFRYASSIRGEIAAERLKAAGLQFAKAEAPKSDKEQVLAGKSFVVSGVFANYTRDGIKETIEAYGGKNVGSISGKTDYVLAGDKMGPEKRKKAESLGIPIITEAEFEKMIGMKREIGETGLLF